MRPDVPQRRVAIASGPGRPQEVVSTRTEALSSIGHDQALVKVHAAALNRVESMMLASGQHPEGAKFPVLLGSEGAGTVIAAGSECKSSVGDRVCWGRVPGSCADYVIAPGHALVPIPDELDTESAARLPSASIMAELLSRIWPVAGGPVVIWGAGSPVGRGLVGVLAERGVEVIAVTSGDHISGVLSAGATHAVDRNDGSVSEAIHALTDGRGVLGVFDPIGVPTYRQSLAMLCERGCLISFGQVSGEVPVVDLRELMDKGLFVTKFGRSHLGDPRELPRLVSEGLSRAVRRPSVIGEVGARFSLDSVPDAYDALSQGTSGKVLVVP